MPNVTIGGKSLDVKPATVGFMLDTLLPYEEAGKKIAEGGDTRAIVEHGIAGILLFIGHNDGIDAAWLKAHVVSIGATLALVQKAAGEEAKPGEGVP